MNGCYRTITLLSESNDIFSLPVGVLFFTEMGCELEWFITQAIMLMYVGKGESEVFLWKLKFVRHVLKYRILINIIYFKTFSILAANFCM